MSQKKAAACARDSLMGIIGGDRLIRQTGVESKSNDEFQEGLSYARKDPLAQDKSAIDKTLASYETSSETIQLVRKGIHPFPGFKKKLG